MSIRREFLRWRMPFMSKNFFFDPSIDVARPTEQDLESARFEFVIQASRKAFDEGFKLIKVQNLEASYWNDSYGGSVQSIDVAGEVVMERADLRVKVRNRTW